MEVNMAKQKYYIGTGDLDDPKTNSSDIFHVIFCTKRNPDKVYDDEVLRGWYNLGDVSIKDENGHWVDEGGCYVVNRSLDPISQSTFDELKGIIYTVYPDDEEGDT